MTTPLAAQVEKLEKELAALKEQMKKETQVKWVQGGVYKLKHGSGYHMLTATGYEAFDLHSLVNGGRYYGNFSKPKLQKVLDEQWEFVSENVKQFIDNGGKIK